ncbi:hypothetical protein SASPL_115665 [Salvia splendens]|uniref:RNA-binding protein containing a PIN domain n=1 Tax=Salvia splendens TaxID=180675 RepID=A0A8X8Y8G9_SALSN|nr:hypothetical protein SASPL_115665 [Salvia splendens]
MNPIAPTSSSTSLPLYRFRCYSSNIVAKKGKASPTPSPQGSEPTPPRITSNVKQNLQVNIFNSTNQGLETAIPVLLVDGYNVCGYWAKLKKHFMNGRLDIARQKLVDELVTFSMLREVKVVVVFDAMMSGQSTHRENFAGIDIVFSAETCADLWIEKEVVALRDDGCPKVWVATSDHCVQNGAHGAVCSPLIF